MADGNGLNGFSPGMTKPPSHHGVPVEYNGYQTSAPPPHLNIFEARPISSTSNDSAIVGDGVSPHCNGGGGTWKRRWRERVVEAEGETLKNEIIHSDELLERDRFDIDLLRRRDVFVEKPPSAAQIQRLGKRWEPPPEPPYKWPGMCDHDDDGAEHRWTPALSEPAYKQEHNNFTPPDTPSYLYHHGSLCSSTLDEAAKRQTRHLVLPSPDGSHRPRPAFRAVRHTPAGGFVPHAPNAVKMRDVAGVVDRGESMVESPVPTSIRNGHETVLHTSTLTRRDEVTKRSGNVRQRIRDFETPVPLGTQGKSRSVSSLANPPTPHHYSSELKIDTGLNGSASPHGAEHVVSSASRKAAAAALRTSSQASPSPGSYDRAKPYLPPPLPSGFKQPRTAKAAERQHREEERRARTPAGNTRRMAEMVQSQVAHHRVNHGPLGAKFASPSTTGPPSRHSANGMRSGGGTPTSFAQPSPSTQLPSSSSTGRSNGYSTSRSGRERIVRVELTPYPYYK